MTPDKTLEMVKLMKSYDVIPELSFVMGKPTPTPLKDASDTIEFIRKLKAINPATEVIMYLYTPVPLDGDLYDDAKAQGFAFSRKP